jgi:hypothetical protein
MADVPSKDLSLEDEKTLAGFDDPYWPEPSQIAGSAARARMDQEVPETLRKRASRLRMEAEDLIGKIDATKKKVDDRCKHLVASTGEPRGSRLFQAMWRVFGKRTTVVTYEHYKKALLLRQQLAEEDAERERKV